MIDQMTTLISLAILKVDLDEGVRDYLDYLQSFVIYVLKKYNPDPVTDKKICNLLLTEFGLNLPQRGCQLVLRRMAKRKYLSKENETYIISKELPKINIEFKREKAQLQISNIHTRLIEYVKKEQNEIWDENYVSSTLFAFLKKFGVGYLRCFIFNTALPVIPKSIPKDQFIVSQYIRSLYDTNNPLFDSFVVLVKGHMYANALMCPDLESISKKFNDVTFYIDTPLLLNFLGVQGNEGKTLAIELFQLIKKLKGSIAVFEHTIEETKNVLIAAEMNIDKPDAVGRVIREMRKLNFKRSDIILLREKFDLSLSESDISITHTPKYKKETQISESELESVLTSKINYKNPGALKFDINSVRSIYTLRDGIVPRRLEDAKAIFVTTNTDFSEIAFDFGKTHNSTKEVSSVITDFSLANVAWLKAPLGAPELPTKGLIAACYAAMEPSKTLLVKYLDEIEKQKDKFTADDHALLRISPIVSVELMNLTKGDEDAFTGSTVRSILDRVKADLVKDKTITINKIEAEKENIITERDKFKRQDESISANIYWLAERITTFIVIFLKVLVFPILFCAALFCSSQVNLQIIKSPAIRVLSYFIFVVGLVWGFLNWCLNLNFKDLFRNIEQKILPKVHRFLKEKIYTIK